jgi:hypothetical protein
MIYKFNPGSVEATTRGCLCSEEDNDYGAGYRHNSDIPGQEPRFVTAVRCPLHGRTYTPRPTHFGMTLFDWGCVIIGALALICLFD